MSTVLEKDWITGAGLRAVCLWVHNSHRCGYVEVPAGHPLNGSEYNRPSPLLIQRSPDEVFDVHGGLTFSGPAVRRFRRNSWWFGFDCAHAGDATAYFSDGVLRSVEYVVGECESLARQIVDLFPPTEGAA